MRPTTPAGATTAMSAARPSPVPLSMVTVRNSGLAPAAITSAPVVARAARARAAASRLRVAPRRVRPRTRSCCSCDLQIADFAAQRLVLAAHVAQGEVAVPQRLRRPPATSDAPRCASDDAAEDHRVEHGDGRPGRDLQRDEADVQRDGRDQQEARSLTDVGKCHRAAPFGRPNRGSGPGARGSG